MAESKWKVGDLVVVEHSQGYHRQQEYVPKLCHGTVIKVARKYFTARLVSENGFTHVDEFEITNGIQRGDPNYPQYRDHAYTPEGWDNAVFRRGIESRLRDDHRVFSGAGDSTMAIQYWSDHHLIELIELLDRVKAHREKTNLD